MLILLVPMGIMGILTPYGTGHSPIWFASGYNKGPEFWKLGAIFGIIYLAIFIVVGIPWIQFVMPLLGIKCSFAPILSRLRYNGHS